MRAPEEVATVLELVRAGLNDCEIARRTGIPRGTIRCWRIGRVPNFQRSRAVCPVCAEDPLALPQSPYTYLLGLYLGDGCLAAHPRDVYRLRISCASAYPELIRRCEQAITEVLPVKINKVRRQGCFEVYSFSKHWICLFPQQGPGRKHQRKIELAGWQQELIDVDPRPLLRGLLHSDGCRVLNWVKGTSYPRYHFINVSSDIRAIFRRATRWGSSGGRTTAGACRWQVGERRPARRIRGTQAVTRTGIRPPDTAPVSLGRA
jgi:hypothetical protein